MDKTITAADAKAAATSRGSRRRPRPPYHQPHSGAVPQPGDHARSLQVPAPRVTVQEGLAMLHATPAPGAR
jgi:hypothetical protein